MRAYYSLVDDLFSFETFQALVEEVCEDSGNVFDERTSGMIVLRRAGRKHQKIARLAENSTHVHFFSKVLQKGEIRTFTRDDGSPGAVTKIEVGDDSGEVSLVFWDERVSVVEEIGTGDVIEVVGKVESLHEVRVIDLQKTVCDIPTRNDSEGFAGNPHDGDTIDATIVAIGDVSTFTRRDGNEGKRVDVAIADETGVGVLVVWNPDMLEGFVPGDGIHASGLRRNLRSAGREYSAGSHAAIGKANVSYPPLYTLVSALQPDTTVSVSGTIFCIQSAREFTTRKGTQSWVCNAEFRDESGTMHLVLWGDNARDPPAEGDTISLFNASCRTDRRGNPEIHASWGCLLISDSLPKSETVSISGMIIETVRGRCIDDGQQCLLIDTDLPFGTEYCVEGIKTGDRLSIGSYSEYIRSADLLKERIRSINE
ncbi:OB-fold nucleic acid binding domain-containing protein [Methanogenium sp. S4BF]|nr:OB-fold nucleic acid binding domain-containing protein [Methanogenium sp. S4BF]WFN35672.1 OB-fold nucleic acid binding domain-containing protein [Methanogenium sp. S4BF]